MDDTLLIRVLARLAQVRVQLGDRCYEDAAHGALVAIGRSAMRAADTKACLSNPCNGNVVRLRSHRSSAEMDDDERS